MSNSIGIGDRVICTNEFREDIYSKEGVVREEWCEYGHNEFGVDFDDGTYAETDVECFELLEDPYEYAVQRTSPAKSFVIGDHWATREEQEEYLESLTTVLPEGVEYKLVKRRKAGRIEDV